MVFSLLSFHPYTETGGTGKVQMLKKGVTGSAEATVEKQQVVMSQVNTLGSFKESLSKISEKMGLICLYKNVHQQSSVARFTLLPTT